MRIIERNYFTILSNTTWWFLSMHLLNWWSFGGINWNKARIFYEYCMMRLVYVEMQRIGWSNMISCLIWCWLIFPPLFHLKKHFSTVNPLNFVFRNLLKLVFRNLRKKLLPPIFMFRVIKYSTASVIFIFY